MFRSDLRRIMPAGPTELPPYYAQRLQVVEPPTPRSARYEPSGASPEAQAERLFRDFKLGLLALVIVSLLLLAYFWDGGHGVAPRREQPHEDVLSFSVGGRRRADVLPLHHERLRRTPGSADSGSLHQIGRAQSRKARPLISKRPQAYVYTVKSGDTLSAIALRFYGDASLWRMILTANSRRLRRPSDLKVGMKLIVPVQERPGSTAHARPIRS